MSIYNVNDQYHRDIWHFGEMKGMSFSSSTTSTNKKAETEPREVIAKAEKATIDARKSS